MNTQDHPTVQTHDLDFMLAEYEALRDLRAGLVSFGESRINFLLATVSGALVGLALISQLSGYGDTIYIVSCIILAGLFFLGMITFARTVENDIGIKIYTRGINRIRHYFAVRDPDIKNHLILPVSDDVPSFTRIGFLSRRSTLIGMPATVAAVNSIVAAASISVFVRLGLAKSTTLTFLIALLTFIVTLSAQYRYHIVRLREAEERTDVRFPSG
jgi:hypothetical protein